MMPIANVAATPLAIIRVRSAHELLEHRVVVDADNDDQRIVLEPAETCELAYIEVRTGISDATFIAREHLAEHRVWIDASADFTGEQRTAGQLRAIGGQQLHKAFAQIYLLIEQRQLIAAKRENRDAGEFTVRTEQLTGELDRVLPGGTAEHRLADVQFVARGIELRQKVRPIGYADLVMDGQGIGEHVAGAVGHPDCGGHLIGQRLGTCPLVEVEAIPLRRIERTRAQQDLVDLADGPTGTLLEGAGQIGRRLHRGTLRGVVFVVDGDADTCPEQDEEASDGNKLGDHRLQIVARATRANCTGYGAGARHDGRERRVRVRQVASSTSRLACLPRWPCP